MYRDKETVSWVMSKIKSSGSEIEKKLGTAMWASGLRYRKQYRIFGKPDFVLVKHKIAIFCDSSFWHGYMNMTTKIHNFKNNKEFWIKKIKRNMERDKTVNIKLTSEGWTVLRFWDFEIEDNIESCLELIKKSIKY